jgi:hypothetical protein
MHFINAWNTTAAEQAIAFPCDAFGPFDQQLWRAITIAAPPDRVFLWLCQLRVAPYSYDLIDNFGRRSPQQLIRGLDRLAIGQPVMTIFEVVDWERDRHLTIALRRWSLFAYLVGEGVITYLVLPQPDGTTRLIAKLGVRYSRNAIGAMLRLVLPAGDLVMMRRQLLNLKRLAERGNVQT